MVAQLFARNGAVSSVRDKGPLWPLSGLALGAFLVQVSLMVCLPRAGFIAHTAPDDAFYYLEIAQRFGNTGWPTFDGQHTTTGFHPLWQLLLVPLAHVTSQWLFARIAVAISAIFMLTAALQIARLVARAEGPVPALVVWILFVGTSGISRFGMTGMETPLGLLLLSSWCIEVTRPAPRSLPAGLLAGLTVLARIDMIIPLAIGHAYLLWRDHKKPKPWLIAATASAAILLPFVLWNVVNTGHTGTISAATKLYAAQEHANAAFGGKTSTGFLAYVANDFFTNIAGIATTWGRGLVFASLGIAGGGYPITPDVYTHVGSIVFGVIMLGALGILLSRHIDRRGSTTTSVASVRPFLLWVFGGGALIHMATCSLLIPGHSGQWYWGLEIGAVVILCGAIFTRFARSRQPIIIFAIANTAASIILVVVTATSLLRGHFDDRKSFGSAAIEVANYLDREAKPGVAVGSRNGGIIGFVAERPVINLDGLVNDWDYLEARRRGEVRSWIQRHGIQYYGDCVVPAAQLEYAQSLGLSPNEVTTVFRIDGRVCEGFVWRIDLPAISAAPTSTVPTDDASNGRSRPTSLRHDAAQ